jgi:hypothetical protein
VSSNSGGGRQLDPLSGQRVGEVDFCLGRLEAVPKPGLQESIRLRMEDVHVVPRYRAGELQLWGQETPARDAELSALRRRISAAAPSGSPP